MTQPSHSSRPSLYVIFDQESIGLLSINQSTSNWAGKWLKSRPDKFNRPDVQNCVITALLVCSAHPQPANLRPANQGEGDQSEWMFKITSSIPYTLDGIDDWRLWLVVDYAAAAVKLLRPQVERMNLIIEPIRRQVSLTLQ